MKIISRKSTHSISDSYDCLVGEILNRKIKITYKAYNAVERCDAELFDGDKWNKILDIKDVGIQPENSAYNIWDENRRKRRADNIFNVFENMIYEILK